MAKKTIANLENGTFEVISGDSTGEEEISHMSNSVVNVETNTNSGAAAGRTIASNTSSSSSSKKKHPSNNILAKFGFRKKKRSKHGAAASTSSSKSEETPLLETNSATSPPYISFSKDKDNQSKHHPQAVSSRVVSSAASGGGKKSWNKLKVRIHHGDLLLQDASQPAPSTTAASKNDKNKGDRASMVQQAMGEIRSGMEFSLTHCLIAIWIYLLLAIICYHTIFQPEWTIIDACYFAVTTFTTVGYGDLFPKSKASMMFTCLYALTGVACLGIALGILGSNLIDAQEKALSTARELSKYQVLSVFDASSSERAGILQFQEQEKRLQAQQASQGSASGMFLGLLLHVIPLVCVMLGLAFWIGKESGWDMPKTIYYLVITGTTHKKSETV
jgi:hypothetical protein